MGGGEGAPDRHLGHAKGAEDGAGPEAETLGFGDEAVDGVRVDGLGPVERDPQARQVEVAHALESAGDEHPREVGAGGDAAPVLGDPLHPVAGMGEEVLRGGQHEIDAEAHRRGQEPDQSHVVIQREPRHHDVVVVELGGGGDGVEVRSEHAVGDHHALGLAGGPARVLQNDEALRIGCRLDMGIGRQPGGARLDRRQRDRGWVARHRFVERRQLVVDHEQPGVAVPDPSPGRRDELLE